MRLQIRRRPSEPLKFPASTVEEGDRGVLRAVEECPNLRSRCVAWQQVAGVGRELHGKMSPSSVFSEAAPFLQCHASSEISEEGEQACRFGPWREVPVGLFSGAALFLFFLLCCSPAEWALLAWAEEK